jgi:hypothetical protein
MSGGQVSKPANKPLLVASSGDLYDWMIIGEDQERELRNSAALDAFLVLTHPRRRVKQANERNKK